MTDKDAALTRFGTELIEGAPMNAEPGTPMNDLLTSIDRLTKPVRRAFTQHEVEFAGMVLPERIVTITDQSLLEQLAAAVGSSMEQGKGSGRLARERTPVDISALMLLEEIDERVRSWMLDAGIRASSRAELSSLLRRWFIAWKVKRVEDAAILEHNRVIDRWVTQIQDMLEPPVKQELTSRCPRCQKMWVTVGKGEDAESVRALWAVWRENPDDSYGTCRGCGHIWLGVGNMRLLRIAIDDLEAVDA